MKYCNTNEIKESKHKNIDLEYAFHRALLEGDTLYVSKLLQHINLSEHDQNLSLKYKYPPSSLIKSLILKQLKNLKFNTTLAKYLKSNPKEALQLGFLKDPNNGLMIPNRRTLDLYEKSMPDEIKELIKNITEQVEYNIIQNCLTTDMHMPKPMKQKQSERTEYRKREKKFKTLCRFVKKRIYPHLEMYIQDNAIFSKEDFLDLIVHTAMTNDFTHNSSLTLKEDSADRTPTSDALLHHLRKYNDIKEVQKMFIQTFDLTNKIMKTNNMFQGKIDVAIDYTNQLYYGDKNDPMILGFKPDRGTSYGYTYATINIVQNGRRITLLCLPVKFGSNKEDIVRKLVTYAKKYIHVNRVFLDRGFFSAEVIKTLKELNVYFVMPAVKNKRVKEIVKEDKMNKTLLDYIQDPNSDVFKLYPDASIVPYTISNSARTQVSMKLVIVDSRKVPGEKHAFATNMRVNKNNCKIVAHLYDSRWGIETSYRVGKDFLARTTSKNYLIRLFYFQFSIMLYNCWVIVNAMLGLAMYGSLPEKPIISAKLFGTVLYDVKHSLTASQ